jgi:surface antigen
MKSKLITWGVIMQKSYIFSTIFCCSLVFSACTTNPSQEQSGMVIGGILGGALGSQVGGGHGSTVATVIGTLIGASIGGNVGRSMDEQDRIKVSHTLESVQTGVPSRWRNPDSGNHYTMVPTKTYDTAGQPCREYTIDGYVGGKKEEIYGTACRQADGSWKTVK